jgi:predicted ATPase
MITKVEIENYKSIRKLTLELGRMNVFIGENGCGKTNILEAIALGSAASRDKLDNEYLVPRGIRVTAPEMMCSAFEANGARGVRVRVTDQDGGDARLNLRPSGLNGWRLISVADLGAADLAAIIARVRALLSDGRPIRPDVGNDDLARTVQLLLLSNSSRHDLVRDLRGTAEVPDFLVFCAENTMLRRFDDDPPILPLGVRGEGVFEHLQDLAARPGAPAIAEINEHLELLDWFERFEVPSRDMAGRALRIRDRYLAEGVVFDQKSANEGFLFLLFYLTLFISPHTPRFFAVDNVDASLNPKLCQALMASLVALAKKHEKQAIVTTHNPSLLDGLDLHDPDQRLFVVSRDDDGATQIHRVPPPKPLGNEPPIRLSTAFMRGYIGGLPKNF